MGDLFGEVLMVLGAVLILIAGLGVARFHDALNRMHALAKASTLGIILVLGGAMVITADAAQFALLLLAGILHVLASPPASNMVSRAVYLAGAMPHERGTLDEGAEALGVEEHDVDEGLY